MIRREEERLDRPPGDDNQTTGQYLGPLFASWEDHLADRRELYSVRQAAQLFL